MFENIELASFLVNLAIFLVPVVAAWAANIWRENSAALERKIEAEIGEKWWNLIETAASTLIHAAEQVSGIDTNEEKKEFVLDHLWRLAVLWKIPLTQDQLDAIIEGVYKGWHKRDTAPTYSTVTYPE